MVKGFSWNIIPWNALLFEKTVKQYQFSKSRRNVRKSRRNRGETCGNKGVIFSRLRWPIEPKFSQVCYFIYKLWYTKCGPCTILFTESVQWLWVYFLFSFSKSKRFHDTTFQIILERAVQIITSSFLNFFSLFVSLYVHFVLVLNIVM